MSEEHIVVDTPMEEVTPRRSEKTLQFLKV